MNQITAHLITVIYVSNNKRFNMYAVKSLTHQMFACGINISSIDNISQKISQGRASEQMHTIIRFVYVYELQLAVELIVTHRFTMKKPRKLDLQ